MSDLEGKLELLESRLDRVLGTIERHNVLLESLLDRGQQHSEEHDFLRQLIEEKKITNQIKHKVLTNLITAGLLGAIGATITAITLYIKELLLA